MKLKNTKTLLSLMMAMTIFIFSCQKDNNTAELSTGKAIVNVKMGGIGSEDGSKLAKASVGGSSATTAAMQQVTVPFGEDLVVRATLTEVKASQGTALRASATKAATTSTGAGEITAFNGDYTIRAYKKIDANNETLVQTVNGVSSKSNQFELEPGNYKFVVSAYGNPAATGEDKDPLSQVIEQTVTAGNNTLDVILKHKLTEITVKFDAGSGRTINAISNSTVKPNYNYTFDEATGAVTFGTELAAKGFTFPTQAAAQTWTSSPVMIAVDNSNGTGEVKLANVTINNKPGNVSLPGLTLKKGVQYVLELNLGAKQGIEAGGIVWSDGNLKYDKSTGVYSFGEKNSAGDYWFPNYTKPKVIDTENTNPSASTVINGSNGDPCKLVSGAGWRLPTKAEYQALKDATAPRAATNPNTQDPWRPARLVDYYDGTSATPAGTFFGVRTDGGKVYITVPQRDNYLFFSFRGYYPNDNVGSVIGTEGAYMAKDGAGFTTFHLTRNSVPEYDVHGVAFRNASETEAVQIRCVKN